MDVIHVLNSCGMEKWSVYLFYSEFTQKYPHALTNRILNCDNFPNHFCIWRTENKFFWLQSINVRLSFNSNVNKEFGSYDPKTVWNSFHAGMLTTPNSSKKEIPSEKYSMRKFIWKNNTDSIRPVKLQHKLNFYSLN